MASYAKDSPPKERRRVGNVMRMYRRAPMQGDVVEVGVFKGKTARPLYEMSQRREQQLWLYDTFNGHPHPFIRRKKPYNGIGAHVPDAESMRKIYRDMPNANIIKGEFPYSADVLMTLIAFAHVDVDSYESTTNTINHLKPLMTRKGIMYFDDYRKHDGAKRAVHEHFEPYEVFHRKDIMLGRAFAVVGYDADELARRWGIVE